MKRIIGSSVMMMAVLAVVITGTGAFFSDSETSEGNVFTAGSIDLMVNHTAAKYNGQDCVLDCQPGDGPNLLINGGFEEPDLEGANWDFFSDDTDVPGWDLVTGNGIEIQGSVYQSADGSNQHFEFDGDGTDAENTGTTIAQTFTTTPGQRYQLSFFHSPRPDTDADDNTFEFDMNVVDASDNSTNLTDSIESGAGTGSVNWQQETYEFIASGNTSTITFEYTGDQNTFGGLLDEVEVVAMECIEPEFDEIGHAQCELWESRNLTNESFFNFSDLKPADHGSNLISLTVESNEAFMCFRTDETSSAPGTEGGNLNEYIEVMVYASDEFGNETELLAGPSTLDEIGNVAFAEGEGNEVVPGDTNYMLFEWCFGEFENDGTCNGDVSDINSTQLAELEAAMQFFAIQSRNNGDFTCDMAEFGEPIQE